MELPKFKILVSDEGLNYEGNLDSILVGIAMLVNSLYMNQDVPKELLQDAFDLAFKSSEELEQEEIEELLDL